VAHSANVGSAAFAPEKVSSIQKLSLEMAVPSTHAPSSTLHNVEKRQRDMNWFQYTLQVFGRKSPSDPEFSEISRRAAFPAFLQMSIEAVPIFGRLLKWRAEVAGLSTGDTLRYVQDALSQSQQKMPSVAAATSSTVPLCVDLDGTLIHSDLLWESFGQLLRRNPLFVLLVPLWLLKGRSWLKRQIATRVTVDVEVLPFNEPFVEFLREEKNHGRKLLLVTASDRQLAQRVADHLGLFDEVIGSDGKINLRGSTKGEALVARFGERGFDYAGDSRVDLPVWACSREAIVVNANQSLVRAVLKRSPVQKSFGAAPTVWPSLIQTLRPHQWIKNVIIFVPLVTSHQIAHPSVLRPGFLAFVAFCLCASALYTVNDLFDLKADRHHPTKRHRPLASGRLPLSWGFALAPLLLAASALIASLVSLPVIGVLAVYAVASTVYSWRIKQIALLDVFVLAGLYTIRLVAGHVAANIEYSVWLLAFSMFVFLSLALMKRFQELRPLRLQNKTDVKGRGYIAGDLELVTALGTASGYLSVLILTLYVNSEQVRLLYLRPTLLLLICPLLLYWISRVWMVAHRGQMHDDPVVFALKDGPSYVVGALILLIVWAAT
jgi:4-hydroxybenzoate polyprenyltransferase/phosphoserine phosphatase